MLTIREAALRKAITQIGVTEHPPNSNSGPEVNEYLRSAGLGPGFPWCMAFVHWNYEQVGLDLVHPNQASVGFFEEWARKNGFIVAVPQRGDVVCYDFDADNWPDHVGIVEEVGAGRINTVEGNTAFGNDANGGMVMRRSRSTSRCVFARIPGVTTQEDSMTPAEISAFLQWYITDRRDETKPKNLPSPIPDDVMSLVGLFADIHVQLGPPALFDTWADWKALAARGVQADRPKNVPQAIPNLPRLRWWDGVNRSLTRVNQAVAPLEDRVKELEAQGGISKERLGEIKELIGDAAEKLDTASTKIGVIDLS